LVEQKWQVKIEVDFGEEDEVYLGEKVKFILKLIDNRR
jgi:hypothetical protein